MRPLAKYPTVGSLLGSRASCPPAARGPRSQEDTRRCTFRLGVVYLGPLEYIAQFDRKQAWRAGKEGSLPGPPGRARTQAAD